jgi:hypothetical protein
MSLSSLMPWKWSKLDPARTQAARRHFDEIGGYDEWHAQCQKAFTRKIPSGENSIATSGMEVVTVLSPAEATTAKQLLLDSAKQFQQKKKAIDYADTLAFESTDFLTPIMEKMFGPEIDARITRFFGSEYFVQGLVANRTMPAKEAKRSFLWHGDRGPKNFLKINLFLDATSEHGGTTEFLNIAESAEFEKIGYTFGANDRRVSDLSAIARKAGVTPHVAHPQLDAGQAFMFLPSRSLHRGFLPTKGVRHMLLAIILPSPIHWRKAWDHMSPSGYYLREGDSFPDKAGDLRSKMGLEALRNSKAA